MSTQTKKHVVRISLHERKQIQRYSGVMVPPTIHRKRIDRIFDRILEGGLRAA